MKSLRFQIKQKGGEEIPLFAGSGYDTINNTVIVDHSDHFLDDTWTRPGQAWSDTTPSLPPSLLYPANFQHLHADTRIWSGFSFATAIQSCKSGGGVALLVAAIELLLDRRTGGREREREEERPTNPGFT